MADESNNRAAAAGVTVTQRDIAKRAGLTQKTVSLALRGAAEVSASTVERVQTLAEEMGYAPNPLVSSLMRTRRGKGKLETGMFIGWHGPSSSLRTRDRGRHDLCDTYAEMVQGAREACRRNGFGLEVFPMEEPGHRVARILRARGIRGLVLGPIGSNRVRDLPLEELKGVHLVRAHRDQREGHFDRVASDAFSEVRVCVDALFDAGCRRIGYIDDFGHQASSEDRWVGAFYTAAREGLELCEPDLFKMEWTRSLVLRKSRTAERLDAYLKAQRPDGMVVSNRSFIGAMLDRVKDGDTLPFACLQRNGWPDWVSGVEADFHQIGFDAAQLLINRILSPHAPNAARRTIAVHSRWYEGTSHLRRPAKRANERKKLTAR